jgi:hypothetical protein
MGKEEAPLQLLQKPPRFDLVDAAALASLICAEPSIFIDGFF